MNSFLYHSASNYTIKPTYYIPTNTTSSLSFSQVTLLEIGRGHETWAALVQHKITAGTTQHEYKVQYTVSKGALFRCASIKDSAVNSLRIAYNQSNWGKFTLTQQPENRITMHKTICPTMSSIQRCLDNSKTSNLYFQKLSVAYML